MHADFLLAVAAMIAMAGTLLLPALWNGARRSAYAVALALPVMAIALYALVGTPAALDPRNVAAPATFDAEVAALARRMRASPGDLDGWVELGSRRKQQQRYRDATFAFARAVALAPSDPSLMVALAEAIALDAPDHRIDGPALRLLESARRVDPVNQRALWFLGIARYQQGRFAEAASTWQPLLALAPEATRPAIRAQIDGAREKAGMPPLPPAPATGTPLLTVRVVLAPSLRARVGADDVLFVYARMPGGPPMPLAVKRIPAKAFPLTVTLADSDGPMPTMRLSQQPVVALQARISRSGDALPHAGDVEAAPVRATVGAAEPIVLTIDRIHP